jgi:hypothetical protein
MLLFRITACRVRRLSPAASSRLPVGRMAVRTWLSAVRKLTASAIVHRGGSARNALRRISRTLTLCYGSCLLPLRLYRILRRSAAVERTRVSCFQFPQILIGSRRVSCDVPGSRITDSLRRRGPLGSGSMPSGRRLAGSQSQPWLLSHCVGLTVSGRSSHPVSPNDGHPRTDEADFAGAPPVLPF